MQYKSYFVKQQKYLLRLVVWLCLSGLYLPQLQAQFDVTQATYVPGNPFSVGAQETNPEGIAFSNDGRRMFVVGYASDAVSQYELSTPFDIATASFTPATNNPFSIANQSIYPTDIAFSSDGHKMFIVEADDEVNQYELSTAFDITTASFTPATNNPFLGATQGASAPSGITFSSDGRKMFIVDASDEVRQYELSTAFDITTASFTPAANNPISVESQETSSRGITFSADGRKMFIVGHGDNEINQYELSTAFDITTASFTPTTNNPFSVVTQEADPTGIAFSSDGHRMFIVGTENNEVNQYELSIAFDVTTASFTSKNPFSVEGRGYDITFSNDGHRMFIADITNDEVRQYKLSTAFDLTTASFTPTTNNPLSVGAQTSDLLGITFSSDGRKMFIVGGVFGSAEVNQYTLSTAFDITTASFTPATNNPFSVASFDRPEAYEAVPRDIAFSKDGLKMFIIGVKVNQYELTTAFDITTASFTPAANNPFSVGGTSITLSKDGLKMFIAGRGEVSQYALSTAFDITTASFTPTTNNPFSVVAQNGIAFSSDGRRMFMLGEDLVHQYTIAAPEINVQGNGVDIASEDTTPSATDHTSFSDLTTTTRTFTIQNTGTAALNLTGTPIVSIAGSSDFTITTQPSANTIVGGGSLTFEMTYTPNSTGVQTATISIESNDNDERAYTFVVGNEQDTQASVTALEEEQKSSLYIPTLFSSNTTTPFVRGKVEDIKQIKVKVYTTKGQLVFESANKTQLTQTGWTSGGLQVGIYLWTVEGSFTDDTPLNIQGKVRGKLLLY